MWLNVLCGLALCSVGVKLMHIVMAPGFQVKGKHVFISGGSSGLGLALAKKYAQAGAKVSIISRSESKLETAKREIEAAGDEGSFVFTYSCDVTDYQKVQKALVAAIEAQGDVVNHVVCCAGLALPGYFVDQEIEIFQQEMDLNYFGALHVVKAALPLMINAGIKGKIVFVSSACGYIGFIGYSQYSPSKYAVRGLADSIRNELKLYDISVHVFCPGNMDTAGFEIEEKGKPYETQQIEGSSKIVNTDDAADSLISGISSGAYAITNDIGVYMLRVVGNGMAPRDNNLFEFFLAPIAVLLQVGYLFFMDSVVKKSKNDRATKAKVD